MRRKLSSLLALSGFVIAFNSTGALAAGKTMIAGNVKVENGDTVKFDGMPIKLWGIDAPEAGQKCGKTDAGALAQKALRDIADGHRAVCDMRAYDSEDKRAIAQCTVDGEDIAATLVQEGWAWDLPKVSKGVYGGQQSEAKAALKGVHILSCDSPSKWRYKQKLAEQKRLKKKMKLAARDD